MAWEIIKAGLVALVDYIGLHVLTCLIPAFLLAGGLVTFVNREAILHHLGARASRAKAFPLAGLSSFLVAACSCTVIPVASGLYFSGASVGVAFIILWVAPSSNLLSLIYTGHVLGYGIVLARVVSALLMAWVVGLVMSLVFRSATGHAVRQDSGPAGARLVAGRDLILLALILASLLLPNYLIQSGPYVRKVLVWAAATAVMAIYAWRAVAAEKLKAWLRETWWFVRAILPLLLAGVFVVGIIGRVLPEGWIRGYLGGNGLGASFLATLIGAISYFATLTEAPFVDTLMKLGMGKGPALALLLTGPGLSLPNWLAIAKVFGFRKALVYVPTIIVLGTLVGWFYGNFVP